MAKGRIILLMETVCCISMIALVVVLRYSFVRRYRWGKVDKGYTRSLSCSPYYFLQLHMNLQLPQNKTFNAKIMHKYYNKHMVV